MLLKEILQNGRQYLKQHHIDSCNLDAQVLLSYVTGLDRTGLILREDQALAEEQQGCYESLLERRSKGEPVAYLIGTKEFMGLDFIVSPAVLIPRPETELMVGTALEHITNNLNIPRVAVDVGTGSGAIAVSLAYFNKDLQVYAVDISEPALEIAKQNAQRQQVPTRVQFYLGNLLEPINKDLEGHVGVITANLPYVPTGDIHGLMKDVAEYEPHLALDGGADGLDLYRNLIPRAYKFLCPGGILLMEIDPGQAAGAKKILPKEQWEAKVAKDLAGRERMVVAKKL